MNTPSIVFDLKTMLPTIREAFDNNQLQAQKTALEHDTCLYAGPCAIGVCIPPEKRHLFDDSESYGETSAGFFLKEGLFQIPSDQQEDFVSLQSVHDGAVTYSKFWPKEREAQIKKLGDFITYLEGKYL